MTAWCTECGDEFAPVEYVSVPLDSDEPRFCSSGCEELHACVTAYDDARYSGAPAF